MISPILIDLLIIAALLFFAWRGERKGFVLTLCSLLAVVVAFAGAAAVTAAAAPKVAEFLQPRLELSIRQSLAEKVQQAGPAGLFHAEDVIAVLREKGGVYQWAAGSIEDILRSLPLESYAQQAAKAAAALAAQLARSILFPVAFFLLLIVWAILSHALDLVSKLPVIDSLNHGLGGALGLLKGLIVVYIAALLLCGPLGAIPPQIVQETRLLRLLASHSPLELLGR